MNNRKKRKRTNKNRDEDYLGFDNDDDNNEDIKFHNEVKKSKKIYKDNKYTNYLGHEKDDPVSNEQIGKFWLGTGEEINNITSKLDFKSFSDLPLARIKRIMKADEEVRMVAQEVPIVLAKACKMFIIENTQRAYFSRKNNGQILQKDDIYSSLLKIDSYDFLEDIVDGTLTRNKF